jgi:hypothetical protein
MAATPVRRSFFMQYRAEDFPLYLLSLVLGGALIVPALPNRVLQGLLVLTLVYLAVFFVIRHGVKLDGTFLRVVFEGVRRYPMILVRSWRTARHGVIPIAVIFALTLTAEYFLRPALAGTKWLSPFPWEWAIWGPFLFITLFRVVIFVAHLLRASVVREVMERSPQRKTIARLSMPNHIFQAFVTGVLAHLCLVAPCVLFFMWTRPSNLREALLLTGYAVWTGIAMPLRKRRILVGPGVLNNRLVYQNHQIAHESRFYFTVFHGHHHDSLPSALIGSAAGTGFLENADRGITWLDPLKSIVLVQFNWAYIIGFDMVVHQYIPGVFPFAKATVVGASHHVTHHFGSALPLGIIFRGYVEPGDMKAGYRPNNTVTRWFLEEVQLREKLDPEQSRKFLSLYDYGVAKKAPVSAETAAAGAVAAGIEPPQPNPAPLG